MTHFFYRAQHRSKGIGRLRLPPGAQLGKLFRRLGLGLCLRFWLWLGFWLWFGLWLGFGLGLFRHLDDGRRRRFGFGRRWWRGLDFGLGGRWRWRFNLGFFLWLFHFFLRRRGQFGFGRDLHHLDRDRNINDGRRLTDRRQPHIADGNYGDVKPSRKKNAAPHHFLFAFLEDGLAFRPRGSSAINARRVKPAALMVPMISMIHP